MANPIEVNPAFKTTNREVSGQYLITLTNLFEEMGLHIERYEKPILPEALVEEVRDVVNSFRKAVRVMLTFSVEETVDCHYTPAFNPESSYNLTPENVHTIGIDTETAIDAFITYAGRPDEWPKAGFLYETHKPDTGFKTEHSITGYDSLSEGAQSIRKMQETLSAYDGFTFHIEVEFPDEFDGVENPKRLVEPVCDRIGSYYDELEPLPEGLMIDDDETLKEELESVRSNISDAYSSLQ